MKLPVDIIIPTLRPLAEVQDQIRDIDRTAILPHTIIATCQKVSAAKNRNLGLDCADGDIVITLDDDITGFFPGWDFRLILPLALDPDLVMISARLMNPDGTVVPNCVDNYDLEPDLIYIPKRTDMPSPIMPSAAIAFRNLGLRYDEGYLGSGFEDMQFMAELYRISPEFKFAINNNCRLIHLNEKKQQLGPNWILNERKFREFCKNKKKE